MLQEDEQKYKPHAPSDPAYLEEVRKSISAKGALEEIHFEYLNEAFQAFGVL